MANLLNLIHASPHKGTLSDLFMNVLHNEPFCLRYSLDNKRPDWVLIHPTARSDITNAVVQEANGIILTKKDYNLVAQGMPLLMDPPVELEKHLSDFKIERSEDGTVMRVFWNDDIKEWTVSTNRRIDASSAKWQSLKDFSILFMEAVSDHYQMWKDLNQVLEETLDKTHVHSFILLHPENTLVIPHVKPRLVYVSARNMTTGEETCDLQTLRPEWSSSACSINGADHKTSVYEETLAGSGSRPESRGLILSDWSDPKHVKRYKLDNKWYTIAHELRKNQPNIALSYLACDDEERYLMAEKYFWEYKPTFDAIEQDLYKLRGWVYRVYRNSFVRRHYRVPQDHILWETFRQIHRQYRTTGVPIRQHDVSTIVNNAPPQVIFNALTFLTYTGFAEPIPAETTETQHHVLKMCESEARIDTMTGSAA